MLRILLIILVALAVIIGLMRLTGAKPGDAAPAAATEEVIDDAADGALPTEDVIIDEPAVDTLGAPAGTEGDTTTETLDPAADPALDGAVPLEEVPADMAPAAPDNASPVPGPNAGPAIDPAPPVEDVLEEPQPDAPPGR